MITDLWFYAAAVPAVLLVGLSKGGFGGSLALLGVPLMALTISPVQAAAILLPILIVMDIIGVVSYRRVFDTRTLAITLPAAVFGIAVGWATARYFDDATIRLVIGVISLLFVADYWRKPAAIRKSPADHNRPKGMLWGGVAGFTSFLAHAGGPPYQMYALPLRMEPRLFAGTAVMFFAVVNAIKVIPYFFLGQFGTENLMTSLALMPLAPAATLAGVWLVRRVSKDPFYTFTYACILLAGIKLVWDGANGLL